MNTITGLTICFVLVAILGAAGIAALSVRRVRKQRPYLGQQADTPDEADSRTADAPS